MEFLWILIQTFVVWYATGIVAFFIGDHFLGGGITRKTFKQARLYGLFGFMVIVVFFIALFWHLIAGLKVWKEGKGE